MSGVQHARPPAHGMPLPSRFGDRRRLAPQRAVDVEHRITADDNAIRAQRGIEVFGDLLGLGAGERVGDVARLSIGTLRRDDGVLVDARYNDDADRFRLGATPFACPVRRTRAPRASSAHVRPLQQRHPLPTEDRVAQLVDRMSPQIEFLRSRFDSAHRRRRSAPRPARRVPPGRLALDDLDVVDRVCRRRVDRQLAWVADLGDVGVVHGCRFALSLRSLRELRSAAHSGMFPCFFGGVWVILRSSSRRAVDTYPRVCDGGMTASTYPRSAAM